VRREQSKRRYDYHLGDVGQQVVLLMLRRFFFRLKTFRNPKSIRYENRHTHYWIFCVLSQVVKKVRKGKKKESKSERNVN
jgi:hypothetical protein